VCDLETSRIGAPYIYDISNLRVNGLPKITDNDAKVVLFAYDTSIVVINFNQGEFPAVLNKILSGIISWFKANFPSLNFNETYYLEFRTENCIDSTLDIIPTLINLLLMLHIQSFWV
jgi:hypothetical protein